MASLKEAALNANKEQIKAHRKDAAEREAKALDDLLSKWDERATLVYKGDPLPQPDRDAFTWVGYPGFPYQDGRGRNPHVNGWMWETDGITFIYDAGGNGLCVLVTCPDCGEKHADHVYGLEGLGALLRRGRSSNHECFAVAARELAYAISRAARASGLSPDAIVEQALQHEAAYR